MADRKILSVGNQSRRGHRNALFVEDDYLSLIQGYTTKTKDTSETKTFLQKFCSPSQSWEESSWTIRKSSRKRVNTSSGIMTFADLIAQKPTEPKEPSAE